MDPVADGGSSEFLLREPEDQAQARVEERDNVFQTYPILQELVERFKKRIAFYDSVQSIPPDTRKDPALFMHTVDGNDIARRNLQDELNWVEALIKEHLQPNI